MKLKITDSELYCVVFLLLISIFYSCKAFAGNCPAEPTQMSVPYGERITCEINPESDTDVFYFSGTKGDRVVATLDRISGEDFRPIMKMYAPDGEYLDYSFTKIDKSLPKTGIYSVTVNDNSQNYSGQYAFGVSCLGGACLPSSPSTIQGCNIICNPEPTEMFMNFGTRVNCEINPGSDTDVYHFTGTKGDRVVATLDKISGEDFRPIMKMYAPDGEYLDYSFTKIDKSLPKTGIYSVTVNDNSQNYSGQYAFGVSCLGGNCLPNGNFDCSGATLSSADLSIHIPVLNMQTSNGNVPIWVDFSYQQHLKDGIYFKVLNYGIAK